MADSPIPISQELFDELCTVHNKLVEDRRKDDGTHDVSPPFLPFVGDFYKDRAAPRIMFVGKATAGWEESKKPGVYTIDGQLSMSRGFCLGEVATGKYSSSFWHFLCLVTREFHRACGLPADETQLWSIDRLVWTNLMKIGIGNTQPPGKVAKIQRDIASKILSYELKVLKPNVIVILTNDYESNLVTDVFGSEDQWTKSLDEIPKPHTWKTELSSTKSLVFWTRHPQGWPKESRNEELGAMCRAFAGFWKGNT